MLHLIGMPRSGTRVALEYISDCAAKSGVPNIDLNEPFNPWCHLQHEAGKLRLGQFVHQPFSPQQVCARWQLIKDTYAKQQIILKHVWYVDQDTHNTELMALMHEVAPWPWVSIRRQDEFEQLLSYLIGLQTNQWHQLDDNSIYADLVPFEADMAVIDSWMSTRNTFNTVLTSLRDSGRLIGEIWYEDLRQHCDHVGKALIGDKWCHQTDWLSSPPTGRVRKSTNLLQKRSLITNISHVETRWQELHDQ